MADAQVIVPAVAGSSQPNIAVQQLIRQMSGIATDRQEMVVGDNINTSEDAMVNVAGGRVLVNDKIAYQILTELTRIRIGISAIVNLPLDQLPTTEG